MINKHHTSEIVNITPFSNIEKLFEPYKIRGLELKNRIVMAPMGTGLSEKGEVGEKLIKHYERRAKGGVGLIIVEAAYVDTIGGIVDNGLQIYDARFIEGLSNLVKAVKAYGAKIAIQLFHPGGQISSKLTGVKPVAPSVIPKLTGGELARALEDDEIHKIISSFGEGAARCKEAGFDAIEIHGAHGYLIWEFLSPLYNFRSDKYGGDLEGRTRFAVECVENVREKVGAEYPILFRISGSDFVDGGLSIEDMATVSVILEKAGVDALDVSAGTYESFHWVIQPAMLPRCCLVPLSARIKKAVRIPVIVAGRINSPDLAENIIKEEKADLIAMGRPLLCDPDFPMKAMSGRSNEIRKCVACNTCMDYQLTGTIANVKCMQNPEVGNEGNWSISPTKKKKTVIVVGGGPGGMESARILALRGNQVTLYEKTEKLGGKLNLIMQVPGKREFEEMLLFYKRELERLKVRIILEKEVDSDLLKDKKPDAIILALGSIPIEPNIPGMDEARVVAAEDIIGGKAEVGDRVVVLGGALTGCDIALYLAEKGKTVTIVRRGERIGKEIGRTQKALIFKYLKDLNVRLISGVLYNKIAPEGLYVTLEGENQLLEAEAIVLAAGYSANRLLYSKLSNEIQEIFEIGDCKKPRDLMSAIHEATEVGMAI